MFEFFEYIKSWQINRHSYSIFWRLLAELMPTSITSTVLQVSLLLLKRRIGAGLQGMSMQSNCHSVTLCFPYLLGRSAKSWHTEEINLWFLEQCKTVASEEGSLGWSGASAAALCFPATECFPCCMEVAENVIRSLLVHELVFCLDNTYLETYLWTCYLKLPWIQWMQKLATWMLQVRFILRPKLTEISDLCFSLEFHCAFTKPAQGFLEVMPKI